MLDYLAQILEPADHVLIGAAACIAGGLIRGFSGFGGGLVLTPLFTILYGPVLAVPISVLINLLVNVQLIPSTKGAIRWPTVTPITIAACLAAPLGAAMLIGIDPELMRRSIGIMVVGFSVLIALGWRLVPEGGIVADLMAGGVGGVLNGAAALGGAPITLYLIGKDGSAASKRADLIAIFGVMQLVTIVSFIFVGLLPTKVIALSLLLLPIYVLASWAGTALFRRSNDQIFNRVAQAFLIIIGIATVLS